MALSATRGHRKRGDVDDRDQVAAVRREQTGTGERSDELHPLAHGREHAVGRAELRIRYEFLE
jgi:hypothetical protein